MSAAFAARIEIKLVKRSRFWRNFSKTQEFSLSAALFADASKTGIALGASAALGRNLFGQSSAPTAGQPIRIYADARRTIAPVQREVFGSFLEHLGRAIYEGVYDPQSKLSDSNGFRKDVLDEIKKMGVPIIRYPGGNFVSGYNWLDGIGPKASRPAVLDKAWNSMNSNEFGTDEFLPGAVSWKRNLCWA